MQLIIEGCDGTGKTSLATKLVAYFPELVYLKDQKHLEGFKYYTQKTLELPKDCVIDRWHLGERVYPTVMQDDRTPLELWQLAQIDSLLIPQQACLILAETDTKTIQEVFNTRGEDYVKPNQVDQIKALFSHAYQASMLPKLKYDFTQAEAFELVVKFIHTQQLNFKLDDLKAKTCLKSKANGKILSPIMLVGDTPNLNELQGTSVSSCFNSSRANSSSAYLRKAVFKSGIYRDCYFTNANKFPDNLTGSLEALQQEILTLNPVGIIALGTVAKRYLTELDVNFSIVNHPSYEKRFNRTGFINYTNQLAERVKLTTLVNHWH